MALASFVFDNTCNVPKLGVTRDAVNLLESKVATFLEIRYILSTFTLTILLLLLTCYRKPNKRWRR